MDDDRERPQAGAVTLLVTPLLPAPGGNGLAMGAGVLLDAEGLDAEDGRHLLTGRSPEELAAACLRLDRNEGLASRLGPGRSAPDGRAGGAPGPEPRSAVR